jgi:hypothetical protein
MARSDYEAARSREMSSLRVLASCAADYLRSRSDENLRALAKAQEGAHAAGCATEQAWQRYSTLGVPFEAAS